MLEELPYSTPSTQAERDTEPMGDDETADLRSCTSTIDAEEDINLDLTKHEFLTVDTLLGQSSELSDPPSDIDEIELPSPFRADSTSPVTDISDIYGTESSEGSEGALWSRDMMEARTGESSNGISVNGTY